MNKQDLEQIKERNVTEEQVERQVAQLKRGTAFVKLIRPATIGDGILKMSPEQVKEMSQAFDEDKEYYQFTKFVPASGAASRMFKDLFTFIENGVDTKFTEIFFAHVHCFAFAKDLDQACQKLYGMDIDGLLKAGRKVDVVKALLLDEGLGYGKLPKALLKFHHYEHFERLALEEHLVEAARYATSNDGTARLHFTVSPEHEQPFKDTVAQLIDGYEKQYGVKYDISYSCQKPSTDTVAIDAEGNLFREGNGKLLFRPGGHGALIENLNDLGQEIVFIKNIDNIVPETRMETTVTYKKVLAGLLLRLQQQTFEYLEMLDGGDVTDEELREIMTFAKEKLMIEIPGFVEQYDLYEKTDFLYEQNTDLRKYLDEKGYPYKYRETDGGHIWRNWRIYLSEFAQMIFK